MHELKITEEVLFDGKVVNTKVNSFPCETRAQLIEAQAAAEAGLLLNGIATCAKDNSKPDIQWAIDAIQAALGNR